MPIESVDIIIPTWNNSQYLFSAVESMLTTRLFYPMRLIVVNNGHPESCRPLENVPRIKVVQCPDNLGWEGGLKEGLKHSDSKFVMFANDDIFIPRSSFNWLRNMMFRFNDLSVGAVGPISNCVMGPQNMLSSLKNQSYFVNYLIGFCMLLKREALESAGGVDDGLPGGDDIDLSIRLRKSGYRLVNDRLTYVHHHGFKTGERIHGTADNGGWNSPQMTEKTNHALIRKHGLREWFDALYGQVEMGQWYSKTDCEGDLIREKIGDGSVLELGCGGNKTVPHSIGVDYYPKGTDIPTVNQKSEADVACSVENLDEGFGKLHKQFDVIIARHILEHVMDPIKTLNHWISYLRPGGRMIIAVPDDSQCESVSLNPEHKHAFTSESMKSLFNSSGLDSVEILIPGNMISLVAIGQLPKCEARDVQRSLEGVCKLTQTTA